MRALIVDDDIPTTQAIRESIDWSLFPISDVLVANSVERARKFLAEQMPEIVICDIEMPRGSGIDLIKWVRENNIDSRFIFLTCHEEFHFASEAIKYTADAYITKPFDVKSMQGTIATVVDKVLYQRKLHQYKDLSERWMSNLHTSENGFWRELLFGSIPPDIGAIQAEITNRGLQCDTSWLYRLLLCSVRESQLEESGNDKSTLRYSLCRLVNSILAGSPDTVRTLDYTANGSIYIIKVLLDDSAFSALADKCEMLIHTAGSTLRCALTCYIGDETAITRLSAARIALEEVDAYNISKRDRVISGVLSAADSAPYSFNGKPIEKLVREERGVDAVNLLRRELENLAASERLNSETMHRIQHDYMQIIYSVLYDNNVQAHELFSDPASQKLYHSSGYSAFDMMKWASHITDRTFQHIREMRETETVVNRVKRFIAENYMKRLTREDIASRVFLSPDYVSKVFHNETGLYMKDCLNEVRIQKARQLIKEGRMNVSEIAAYVGFDNFSYFSSLFKKYTGVSPSEYRKQEPG